MICAHACTCAHAHPCTHAHRHVGARAHAHTPLTVMAPWCTFPRRVPMGVADGRPWARPATLPPVRQNTSLRGSRRLRAAAPRSPQTAGSPARSHAARGAGLRPEAPGPGGGACVGLARAAAHGGGARRQPARWAPLAFFRPNPLNLPPGARALAAFRARLVCPRSGLTAGAGCPQASWPFSLSARTATRPQSASSRGRGRAPRTECPVGLELGPSSRRLGGAMEG